MHPALFPDGYAPFQPFLALQVTAGVDMTATSSSSSSFNDDNDEIMAPSDQDDGPTTVPSPCTAHPSPPSTITTTEAPTNITIDGNTQPSVPASITTDDNTQPSSAPSVSPYAPAPTTASVTPTTAPIAPTPAPSPTSQSTTAPPSNVPTLPSHAPTDPVSPSPAPSAEHPNCHPVSVESDATYCLPVPSDGICSGDGAIAPHGTQCPQQFDIAVADCHPHLPSYNQSTQSCQAPVDASCVVIHTGVWGCTFPYSSSQSSTTTTTRTTSSSPTLAMASTTATASVRKDPQVPLTLGVLIPMAALVVAFIVRRRWKRWNKPPQELWAFSTESSPSSAYACGPLTPRVQ